tara:strand:- start:142 stop:843 length:702 start_codon:yes stop_codon:yes gene_type:complete
MDSKRNIHIGPSLFSADFGYLAEEAKRIEQAGADSIHVDIMDGHFVKNLALTPKCLAAVNRATDIYLDVHIMVYNPMEYVERLVENGADCITFHFEATEDVEDLLNYIRKCNVDAGLAFCPETSENIIPKYLDKCDKILLMTVNPGFGGQEFIRDVLKKIEFTRSLCERLGVNKNGRSSLNKANCLPFDIQVDGGIDNITAELAIKAGANQLVSGEYLFKGDDFSKKLKELRG